uniref:BCAS3 domain-containing protein n=1 Tax=Parastrongyloides trichosuri TaxID=131310 RepID=A0A0N4ZEQ2_PARTI
MTSKSSKKKKSNVSTAMVHPIQNQDKSDDSKNFEPLDDKAAEQLCSSTMKPSEISFESSSSSEEEKTKIKSSTIEDGSNKNLEDDIIHQTSEVGKSIKPQLVPESNFLSSLSEAVTDVIPQNTPNSQHSAEQVLWVKIQNYNFDYKGTKTSHIILFGLARGYQIWLVMENGNIEEIVSERQGPLKIGHLLPYYPEPLHPHLCNVDKYAPKRPLMAMIEAFSPTPESQFCQISFLSFITSTIVTKINFHEPIADVQSSNQCLLVLFTNKIVILDQLTYTVQHEINNIILGCLSSSNSNDLAGCLPAVALSGAFIAYVDKNFNKNLQSCGGAVIEENNTSVSSQFYNAAKTLTKSVGIFSGSIKPSHSRDGSISTDDYGIVTIIDVEKMVPSKASSKIPQNANEYTLAHFVAHDSPIGFLAFAPQSNLLLTAPQSTTLLHLFNINIHSGSSALTTVTHLYTLNRGTSAAKIIDVSFSNDCRWLLVTTNHGTSHLFAINPYGGSVTNRTHSGKFVNKEGKFERSAGIAAENVSSKGRNEKINTNTFFKEHPSVIFHSNLSKSVINPRVQYHSRPINLSSVSKIKPRLFSTENFSAWATDNTFIDLTSMAKSNRNVNEGYTRKFESGRKIATKFIPSFSHEIIDNSNEKNSLHSLKQSILIVNNEGLLTEYTIHLKKERHNSNTSITSTTLSELFSSSPSGGNFMGFTNTTQGQGNSSPTQGQTNDPKIHVKVIPKLQWVLQRTKSCVDLRLPIKENNPILNMINKVKMIDEEELSSKRPKSPSSPTILNNWVENIEASTYSGPHRRLWMGPQILFAQYAINEQHSSADLITPSYETNCMNSKCVPIVYETKRSSQTFQQGSNNTTGNDYDSSSSHVICSRSWSQNNEITLFNHDDTNSSIKTKIEEAMKEMSSNSIDDFDKTDSIRLPSSISTSSSGRSYSDSNQDLMQLSGMDL